MRVSERCLRVFLWPLLFALVSCGSTKKAETHSASRPSSVAQISVQPFDSPESVNLVKIGNLKPSFYWVALEKNDAAPRTHALLDMKGNVLARVSESFWADIRLEGTGKLLDGRVLNYAGRVTLPDGSREVRYLVCPPEAPYGYGIEGIPLVPFRSVAVDPAVVPLGATVYIPQAKGTRLPDGSVHDGFFTAVDVGDAIVNKRIDIFTAYGDQSDVFYKNGLEHGKIIEVFLVQPAQK